jgi:hypothetical protein
MTSSYPNSSNAVTPEPGTPTVEERWALIQRIAASEQFSRSARLREFLLYVGKHSLKHNAQEIHEQEIGAKVFGRSVDYDRSQDNIVRVNATELRRRIAAYFETAGSQEPLLVEIPKGGYTPVFSLRAAAGAPAEGNEQTSPSHPAVSQPVSGFRRLTAFLWPATCIVLATAVIILYRQNLTINKMIEPWRDKPSVAAFWKQFLNSRQQTDIVMPDDSVSLYEDITNTPVNLGDYLSRNYVRRIPTLPISDDRRADAFEILNHNLVTFGAIRAGQLIQAQIPPTYQRFLVWTRLYTADEIKRNNVILVGGQKANPWNQIFEDQLNFVVDYDDSHRRGFVRNRNPKPGEQAEYNPNEVSGATDSLATYSVVAFLPNPSRTGHVLILAGLDSDATAAAAEFLSSEEQMARLRSTMKVDSFPYFEVLLRASRLSGTAFRSEAVAYRIHQNLH